MAGQGESVNRNRLGPVSLETFINWQGQNLQMQSLRVSYCSWKRILFENISRANFHKSQKTLSKRLVKFQVNKKVDRVGHDVHVLYDVACVKASGVNLAKYLKGIFGIICEEKGDGVDELWKSEKAIHGAWINYHFVAVDLSFSYLFLYFDTLRTGRTLQDIQKLLFGNKINTYLLDQKNIDENVEQEENKIVQDIVEKVKDNKPQMSFGYLHVE